MTEEQIRIAIAEACGWKREFDGNHEEPEWYWIPPNDPDGDGELPDYCNDLNAMHEAETATFGSTDLWQKFVFKLLNTCGGSGMDELDGLCCLVQVTALQRAEAFLRTIGKWKEAAK